MGRRLISSKPAHSTPHGSGKLAYFAMVELRLDLLAPAKLAGVAFRVHLAWRCLWQPTLM
jgi:hypothetical protein